ncbi:hypothetical protein O181_020955 [Austropuccinia psidii MF-1]|uniref:Uncharacterized protein n=1 Tax=Austropuccinia psidii MF-1 TaxID=1389203 RepID=A0A9Q3GWL4_9BASI|nr:hypothetical protein [Austropuccinia psidii MF-1]
MRQDHGENLALVERKILFKWENYSWRFRMENSFEKTIFNIERDRPRSWFLKQKYRLTALHPDMSETVVHKRILGDCGGDLEKTIKSRCIAPFSTEDYIIAMEEITTQKTNW